MKKFISITLQIMGGIWAFCIGVWIVLLLISSGADDRKAEKEITQRSARADARDLLTLAEDNKESLFELADRVDALMAENLSSEELRVRLRQEFTDSELRVIIKLVNVHQAKIL